MTIAGARIRGATFAYVVFEDFLIIGALLGASAFAHFGQITVFHSPLGLANALVILCTRAAKLQASESSIDMRRAMNT